jgi:hypothetical protein
MTDELKLTPEQASELGKMAFAILEGLSLAVRDWLEDNDMPAPEDDNRYRTAALMTVADAFVLMVIGGNISAPDRLPAAREHCRNLRKHLRNYHRDTGR